MPRLFASFLCASVARLAFGSLALGAGGQMPAGEPAVPLPLGGNPQDLIAQRPLSPQGKGRAFVFIGGMGDEVSGIMDSVARRIRRASPGDETRAYYHWHADVASMDPMAAARSIAGHIAAYRASNPKADVILVGHSYGGATAYNVATLLQPEEGRVFLLTLDPVSRSVSPSRPSSTTWWGNAFLEGSLSGLDFTYEAGGRWGRCPGADLNLLFRGSATDEYGRHYIHDNAASFLKSRGADPASSGAQPPGLSLWEALGRQLQSH